MKYASFSPLMESCEPCVMETSLLFHRVTIYLLRQTHGKYILFRKCCSSNFFNIIQCKDGILYDNDLNRSVNAILDFKCLNYLAVNSGWPIWTILVYKWLQICAKFAIVCCAQKTRLFTLFKIKWIFAAMPFLVLQRTYLWTVLKRKFFFLVWRSLR